MWQIYALLSALFASFVAVIGKFGLSSGIDSTLATTIRAFIMATFLFVVSIVSKKFDGFSFGMLTGKAWLAIVFSGIAGAISWLFYFYALKSGSASAVSAIDRLSIVFVVLFAALLLGEALTWKSILGAILIAVGALLIVK